MTRRIFLTTLAVTILAVALFGIPLAIVVDRRIHDDAVIELQRAAGAAAVALPSRFDPADPIELPVTESGMRLAVYDRAGHLVGGIGPATADVVVAATADGRVHDGVVGRERVVALPLPGDEQASGAIRAAEPRGEVRERVLRTWLAMAALGALAVAVAAGAGALLARRLTRPVQRLRDASVRLGQGDFTIAAPHSGMSELDDAADALAATAQRLGTLVERERAFAADASHQLRTPLASLRLALENELADPRPDATLVLRDTLADVDRLDDTIRDLLALTRDVPVERAPIALDGLVRDAEARWHGLLAAEGRLLRVDVDPTTAPVLASPTAVSTVLDVLLDNALRHGIGAVTITASPAPRTGALVVVGDEGEVTASDEVLFARRSPEARNHGIGLALARSLAQAEGSRLLVASRRPTAFELVLPGARPR
jgi:signal transduction histidine kinase